MNKRVVIRPAVKEDLEAISRLRIRSILETDQDAYSREQLLSWSDLRRTEALQERILDKCVLVGISSGQIVSTNGLDLNEEEMVGLFVCPAHQGLALGSRMVAEIERLAINFGMDRLRVEAAMPAIGFFQSCRYRARPGASGRPDTRTGLDGVSMTRHFPRRQTRYGARIRDICERTGIPVDYGRNHRLMLQTESHELATIGYDIHDREQWLQPEAAMAWFALRESAEDDGVTLNLVSAFRSVDYQESIILRKRQTGQVIDQILEVSAAPGYSEHHTGRAVDICCPQSKPLEESFEHTLAFEWLTESAENFGFSLSYPRNNRHGIAYEPWHWIYHA